MSPGNDIFAGTEGSSTRIRLDIDRAKIKDVERQLEGIPNGLPRVIQRGTIRTITTIRTRIVRAVNSQIDVKGEKLFEKGNSRRPIRERFERQGDGKYITGGAVTVWGRRLALGRFAPEQHWATSPSGKQVRTHVSYRIYKAGGRTDIKDAFMAKMGSGYEGIFRRKGKDRFPLEQLYGPSIPHVAEQHPAVQQVIQTDAMSIFEANIDRDVNFLLSRKRVT